MVLHSGIQPRRQGPNASVSVSILVIRLPFRTDNGGSACRRQRPSRKDDEEKTCCFACTGNGTRLLSVGFAGDRREEAKEKKNHCHIHRKSDEKNCRQTRENDVKCYYNNKHNNITRRTPALYTHSVVRATEPVIVKTVFFVRLKTSRRWNFAVESFLVFKQNIFARVRDVERIVFIFFFLHVERQWKNNIVN